LDLPHFDQLEEYVSILFGEFLDLPLVFVEVITNDGRAHKLESRNVSGCALLYLHWASAHQKTPAMENGMFIQNGRISL
jgi:hypothetical protein